MSALLPVEFIWTGDAMQPLGRFSGLCDRQFVIGERYILAEQGGAQQQVARALLRLRPGWMVEPAGAPGEPVPDPGPSPEVGADPGRLSR